MAFPVGWPPRPTSTNRCFRFYVVGTTTTAFADSAWLFGASAGAACAPLPYVAAGSTANVDFTPNPGGGQNVHDASINVVPALSPRFILLVNEGADAIEVSFDGTNVHAYVKAGSERLWEDRIEGGISVRSPTTPSNFRIEAW